MRSVRHRALVPVSAVAASTVLIGFHRGDSVLLVEVAGDLALAPASLNVSVQPAQAAQRTFTVAPKDDSAISLPTSLSVEMAPNLTGPVTVEVGAVVGAFIIASGTTTLENINVGGETIAVVMLNGGTPAPVDAGADATGTGGTGGTGGGGAGGLGGAGGEAGASGSGGATGKGGSNGTGGASGSGGATGTGGSGGIDASAGDAGGDA